MDELYLGIEIGGTKLQVAVGDAEGRIVEIRQRSARAEKGASAIRADILDLIREMKAQERCRAVGVGFGGPVDWRNGSVARSHQVAGWEGFPIARWLEEQIGLPVVVENDANTAAFAEALLGAGQGTDPVFYVTLGSGVGGGLVTQGQIYHGALPGEAEIGHVRLDREGTTVEARCSGWAVDRRIREGLATHPDSLLAQLSRQDPGHEARHLSQALEKGDHWAQSLLDELTRDLAWALSHVVHLFHPQVIVLGGGLSKLGRWLQEGIQRHLPRWVMEAFHPVPAIRMATLGDAVVPVGAILTAAARLSSPV